MPRQTDSSPGTSPKQTREQTNGPEGAGGLDVTQVTETGQKSLAAMAHLHSRVFRDALKFNAELLDFARKRINKDIETSDRLSRCESVTDAMTVMTDFCQRAFQDYAEQTTAMMRVGAAIGAQATEEAVAEATRVTAKKDS
jgi:hypothetical protein